MSDRINRRTFLKGSTAAGILGLLTASGLNVPLYADTGIGEMGTVIDLTKCDGCKNEKVPLCVSACKAKNESRYPEPIKPLQPYWPQTKYEDWSDKRHLTNRLTPYNWTFVDHVVVEHEGVTQEIHVPRRCMHCDHPTCQKLCPFSAIDKDKNGAVSINEDICFGGAKCRDVCPWGIPQRQAGVGLYLDIAPKFAGGGVMFKCDLCQDLLAQGEKPRCEEACPKNALISGPKNQMKEYAYQKAKDIGGYVYGSLENSGTSTFYISKVPFAKISQAIKAAKANAGDDKPGRPLMPENVNNHLNKENTLAAGILGAPLAGMALAGLAAYKSIQGGKTHESEKEKQQ